MEKPAGVKKRALLSYSRGHFDPTDDAQKLHSASIIARSLYVTLLRAGYAVEYIDPTESPKNPGKYDLFVGQPSRWVEIAEKCVGAVKILFMPTGHPAYRNEMMRRAREKWAVPHDEELFTESADTIQMFTRADFIMQIGNEVSVASLLAHRIPRRKILPLHYGLPSAWAEGTPPAHGALDRYIHTASELGLRKGLPELTQLFSAPPFNEKLLTLVGEIRKKENPAYWKSRIAELEQHNPRATYLGFIDSASKKYKEVLARHAWYLFPSVEEGEPGTVLEAMTLGLVPLVTRESGIDFALDDDFGASFEKSLAKTLTISTDQWKTLSTKARRYIELFHSHAAWEERLVEIFRSVGVGEHDLRPTASIVLTVHNKEKHIVRLLQALVTNTKSYPTWDLHIVYDGCTDASRKVAQQVLKDFPVPVYEYETPDVWEVKANNHGLKKASGKYCVILQDDNFIYETGWLENMLAWLEEHPKVAILGGLAGVNFFRLDSDPQGENVNRSSYELHQRLDPKMDKVLSGYVFEVDAVMRGPLIMRKELLEKHGYLDETYAPLYNDDMDYCFRMRSLGYGVFCYPIDVVNENLTSAQYKNPGKETFWRTTVEKNQQLFYKRWEKDLEKNHAFQLRVPKPVWESSGRGYGLLQKARRQLHRTAALDIRKEVRARARALFVHLPGSLVRGIIAVLRKVGSRGSALADMLYVHRFEARTIPWRMANGETTLRLNYPLNASSLVCYLGTQDEPWAEAIRSRYGSSVGTIPTAQKSVSEISSSLERLARGKKCTDIDLLCLHMGGKEYEMLEHLIATGLIRKVVNLQVKFDANVPDATARMRSIQKKLRETHEITYQYEFVWENWERKER